MCVCLVNVLCTSTMCSGTHVCCSAQGPFVHLSSIIAHIMSKFITTINRVYVVSSVRKSVFYLAKLHVHCIILYKYMHSHVSCDVFLYVYLLLQCSQNEAHNNELLAAACAVGISSNFAAPIGGNSLSVPFSCAPSLPPFLTHFHFLFRCTLQY